MQLFYGDVNMFRFPVQLEKNGEWHILVISLRHVTVYTTTRSISKGLVTFQWEIEDLRRWEHTDRTLYLKSTNGVRTLYSFNSKDIASCLHQTLALAFSGTKPTATKPTSSTKQASCQARKTNHSRPVIRSRRITIRQKLDEFYSSLPPRVRALNRDPQLRQRLTPPAQPLTTIEQHVVGMTTTIEQAEQSVGHIVTGHKIQPLVKSIPSATLHQPIPAATLHQPISSATVHQPISSATVHQPIPAATAHQPISSATVHQPIPAATVHQPIPTATVHQPISSATVHQPIPAATAHQPISAATVHQPIPAATVHQPIPAATVHQPIPTATVHQPISAATVHQPIPAATVHQPISTATLHQPIPTATVHQPIPAATVHQPIPAATVHQPIPAATVHQPIPTATVHQPIPAATVHQPIPTATVHQPIPTATVHQPIPTATVHQPIPTAIVQAQPQAVPITSTTTQPHLRLVQQSNSPKLVFLDVNFLEMLTDSQHSFSLKKSHHDRMFKSQPDGITLWSASVGLQSGLIPYRTSSFSVSCRSVIFYFVALCATRSNKISVFAICAISKSIELILFLNRRRYYFSVVPSKQLTWESQVQTRAVIAHPRFPDVFKGILNPLSPRVGLTFIMYARHFTLPFSSNRSYQLQALCKKSENMKIPPSNLSHALMNANQLEPQIDTIDCNALKDDVDTGPGTNNCFAVEDSAQISSDVGPEAIIIGEDGSDVGPEAIVVDSDFLPYALQQVDLTSELESREHRNHFSLSEDIDVSSLSQMVQDDTLSCRSLSSCSLEGLTTDEDCECSEESFEYQRKHIDSGFSEMIEEENSLSEYVSDWVNGSHKELDDVFTLFTADSMNDSTEHGYPIEERDCTTDVLNEQAHKVILHKDCYESKPESRQAGSVIRPFRILRPVGTFCKGLLKLVGVAAFVIMVFVQLVIFLNQLEVVSATPPTVRAF